MARAPTPYAVFVALAVAAAGAAAWWLLRPPPGLGLPPVTEEGTPAVGPAPPPPAASAVGAPTGTTLGAPAPTAPAPPRLEQGAIADFGALLIRPVPADPSASLSGLRLDLDGLDRALSHYPLAALQEGGTWRYERLPVGRYAVRATGPGFATTILETRIRRDAETTLEIPLPAGAEVAWRVVLVDGEVPATVVLALLDGRGVRQAATFLTSTSTVQGSATKDLALPPEGRVIGLRPGRYRLRATSPAGESDEQEFEARLGETSQLEFRLRR